MTNPIRRNHVLYASSWIAIAAFASVAAAQAGTSALPDAPHAQVIAAPATPPAPPAQLTVLENTLVRVMTNETITTRHAKTGGTLSFTVDADVLVDGAVAIPRGAMAHGVVVLSKKPGVLTGSPDLILKLVSLDLGGRTYPLYSYQFKMKGTSKTPQTGNKVLRGAAIGAAAELGVIAARGQDFQGNRTSAVATTTVLGAGVGTAVAAASRGPSVVIPAEAELEFHLASPLTVTPVSAAEATRLAQGLHTGGPVLYVRGETP